MPTLSAAVCAMLLVLFIALLAQANSLAKIPRPASKINTPGPGATRAIAPNTVIVPPRTPINIRQTNLPALLRFANPRIFIAVLSGCLPLDVKTRRQQMLSHRGDVDNYRKPH